MCRSIRDPTSSAEKCSQVVRKLEAAPGVTSRRSGAQWSPDLAELGVVLRVVHNAVCLSFDWPVGSVNSEWGGVGQRRQTSGGRAKVSGLCHRKEMHLITLSG